MTDKIVTAEEMRHYDSYTINTIGIPSLPLFLYTLSDAKRPLARIPSLVLMERAALAVRDEILHAFPIALKDVVVVAGSGNNGGDGIAIARLLHITDVHVTILNIGNPKHASAEHQTQEKIAHYYQIPETSDLAVLNKATLIVDAMFGIGIDRTVKGAYANAINAINNTDAVVVAVDMPSGVNTDTGEVMGTAVRATTTVTFAYNKVGLTKNDGKDYAGNVVVANDMGTYAVD